MNRQRKNRLFGSGRRLFFLCAVLSFVAASFLSFPDAAETRVRATSEEPRRSDAAEIAALPSFDSRAEGQVTPVRDQGDSNLCWAYASVSASETSILRSGVDPTVTKENLSLSPEALGYARYDRPQDPLGNAKPVTDPAGSDWYHAAGNAQYCATMLSQWCGPTDKAQPANVNPFENARFHLDNAVQINSTAISEIKLAIAEYGAVTFSYNNLRETEYYNPRNESTASSSPHACTLVGWNDDISADLFRPNGAKQNGGWLVKNSYLSLPYFWLSYDNTSDSVYAFDFTAKQTYDHNYFYDYGLNDGLNYSINAKKACEIFKAKKGSSDQTEFLKAVNVGFLGKNVTVKVDIYLDPTDGSNPESGRKVGGGQASFRYGGFRTVTLDAPVALENGQTFACVASVTNPENSAVIRNMLGKNGTPSFICKNDWSPANNCTPRIKAFTSSERAETPPSAVRDLGQAACVPAFRTVTYNGEFHRPPVAVTLNGATLTENTDYELCYANNKNAGTASILVKGIGEYTGQKTLSFTIEQAEKPPTTPPERIEIEADADLTTTPFPEGWRLQDPSVTIAQGESKTLLLIYRDPENYRQSTATVLVSRKTAHRLVHVARKEATVQSAGNTEYWTCADCGRYFSDANGKNEISDKNDVVIPPLPDALPRDNRIPIGTIIGLVVCSLLSVSLVAYLIWRKKK